MAVRFLERSTAERSPRPCRPGALRSSLPELPPSGTWSSALPSSPRPSYCPWCSDLVVGSKLFCAPDGQPALPLLNYFATAPPPPGAPPTVLLGAPLPGARRCSLRYVVLGPPLLSSDLLTSASQPRCYLFASCPLVSIHEVLSLSGRYCNGDS